MIRNTCFYITLLLITALSAITGCKKFVEVDAPATSLTSDNVFENDATAIAVMTDIYATISKMNPQSGVTINSISVVAGLSSDELSLFGGVANGNTELARFYLYTLNSGSPDAPTSSIWSSLYTQIYIVNLAIDKLGQSVQLTPSVKTQLMGEAKFLRAFFYFYLVNLYGDVPLAVSSDYRENAKLSRSSVTKIYEQIIADLKDAENLLSDHYVASDAKTTTSERLRPNKFAATALLARAYLYAEKWADAETKATAVINTTSFYDTVSLSNVFLKNSKEAIWQIQPVNRGWNTEDARIFVLPSSGPNTSYAFGYPVYMTDRLLNSFEANDKRKATWIGTITVGSGAASATYHYPFKYKSAKLNDPVTEYTMVLRLGEQYLIRAEAKAHLNKITEGLNDLNVIRHRAGLPDATASDQTSLLNLIQQERQVELFTEWGHRWLDLKRTGRTGEVMNVYASTKGASWNMNWALYPIPLYDIFQNPNLTQNAGY